MFFYCVAVFMRDKFEFHLSETGGNQQIEFDQDQELTVLSDHQGVLGLILTQSLCVWSLWSLQSGDVRCRL